MTSDRPTTTEWVYFAFLENKYAAKGIPYDATDDEETRKVFDAWLREIEANAFDEGASALGNSWWDGDAGVVRNPYRS